jgi:uncharacterized phage protein (TIGR02220 family)
MTDEKLIECSAEATGVYVRIMCLMHKSEEYGKISLREKDRQTTNIVSNFALKISKQMPWTLDVVERGIIELLEDGVLFIEGENLCQKRMIKDNHISVERSKSGKKGAFFASAKYTANSGTNYSANAEYEYENESENNSKNESEKLIEKVYEVFNAVQQTFFAKKRPIKRSDTRDRQIRGRIKEGYVADDFKKVFEFKFKTWKGTDLQQYLTIDTLTRPSHFTKYLDEIDLKKPEHEEKKSSHTNFASPFQKRHIHA